MTDLAASTRPRSARVAPTRRLAIALGLFVTAIVVGIVGFTATQEVSVAEAAYFTIITVFAVGFGETIPLDGAGHALTSAIIILGVGSFTFLTITLIEFLVEGHLLDIVGRRRMERELAGLDGHIIICGFGRVGRQASEDLGGYGSPQVVIDIAEDRVARAVDRGLPYLLGDATDEAVLAQAQISRAHGLAACTDDDAENVLIALTARLMQPDMFIVVRVKNTRNITKAHQAGADRVIAPTEIGGRRIAALLTKPAVVDFLDIVTHSSDVDLVLEEVRIAETSSLVGYTLATARLRDRFGANVLAIRRAGGERATTRPDPTVALQAGDVLVVIGTQEDMDRLQSRLS